MNVSWRSLSWLVAVSTATLAAGCHVVLGIEDLSTPVDASVDAWESQFQDALRRSDGGRTMDAAPPDAPGTGAPVVYDIAYVSEIKITESPVAVNSIGIVINRGSSPIHLNDVILTQQSISRSGAVFEFSITPSDAVLSQDRAAGGLSPLASQLIVDSGLANFPIDDRALQLGFTLVSDEGVYDMEAEVFLEIDNVPVVLLFLLHRDTLGETTFTDAERVSSFVAE